MTKPVVGALFAAALVVVIVAVDVVFFRHHAWARLAVNAGIVVVFAAVYVILGRRS